MCVRYTRVGLSHLESTLLAFCFLIALSSVSALSGINRCFCSFCSFFVVLQLVLVVRSGTVWPQRNLKVADCSLYCLLSMTDKSTNESALRFPLDVSSYVGIIGQTCFKYVYWIQDIIRDLPSKPVPLFRSNVNACVCRLLLWPPWLMITVSCLSVWCKSVCMLCSAPRHIHTHWSSVTLCASVTVTLCHSHTVLL